MLTTEPIDVVVVDDERYLRDLAADVLREAGHRVDAFADPRAAREAAIVRVPDVVVTDYQMPELSGVELARSLRTTLGEACPYILLWTGARACVSARDELLVDGVLDKPCRIARLIELVQRGARLHRRRRSGVQLVSSLPPARLDEEAL